MKLFRVTLRGMKATYGISYVVAENTDEAYKKVKDFLDKEDLGFRKERELEKVELIADSYKHSDVGTLLHL